MLPVIQKSCILLDIDTGMKEEVIELMASTLSEAGYLADQGAFIDDLYQREKIYTTAVGYGIAVPHGVGTSVLTPGICITRLNHEIQWDDHHKVDLILMIAVSDEKNSLHLKILAELSRRMMHKEFRKMLREGNLEEIYQHLSDLLN